MDNDKTWKEMLGVSTLNKLMALKMSSNEKYVKDFSCPVCGTEDTEHVIGWYDTGKHGLMMINECPKCHERYRFHGCTTERFNLDPFIGTLYCRLRLQKQNIN